MDHKAVGTPGGLVTFSPAQTRSKTGLVYDGQLHPAWADSRGRPFLPDTKVGTFTGKQSGFSLGGSIIRSKAFLVANLDFARKNTPSGFSLDGSSGQLWNQS